MFEISELFASEITTQVFIIGSIVFIALNALFGASLFLSRAVSYLPSPRPATQM